MKKQLMLAATAIGLFVSATPIVAQPGPPPGPPGGGFPAAASPAAASRGGGFPGGGFPGGGPPQGFPQGMPQGFPKASPAPVRCQISAVTASPGSAPGLSRRRLDAEGRSTRHARQRSRRCAERFPRRSRRRQWRLAASRRHGQRSHRRCERRCWRSGPTRDALRQRSVGHAGWPQRQCDGQLPRRPQRQLACQLRLRRPRPERHVQLVRPQQRLCFELRLPGWEPRQRFVDLRLRLEFRLPQPRRQRFFQYWQRLCHTKEQRQRLRRLLLRQR